MEFANFKRMSFTMRAMATECDMDMMFILEKYTQLPQEPSLWQLWIACTVLEDMVQLAKPCMYTVRVGHTLL